MADQGSPLPTATPPGRQFMANTNMRRGYCAVQKAAAGAGAPP